MSDTSDPLAIGQRLVAVLETGRRTATYKLASLMALIDYSIEHLREDPGAPMSVPIRDLAERVLDLYWAQVLPLEGATRLRQTTGSVARILRSVETLRERSGVAATRRSLGQARMQDPQAYEAAVADTVLTLVHQPLLRLQQVGNDRGACFLYDDSWMSSNLSRSAIDAHGGSVDLFPGVAHALARLSGLLKPTIEILWVEDVRRMNKELVADTPDLMGHLFGRDRVSLSPVRVAFADSFGARCFYCDRGVGSSAPVDHVLPWSKVGLDGLTNLVMACAACNSDKSHSLPAVELVSRAVDRDSSTLESIARELGWPTQRDRVIGAARGLYRSQPSGTPLWSGINRRAQLDLVWAPAWMV